MQTELDEFLATRTAAKHSDAPEIVSDPHEHEGRPAHRQFVLKHGNLFLITDAAGNVHGQGDGLFRDDTRALSEYSLRFAAQAPVFLGARISPDNVLFTADLANRAAARPGYDPLPEGIVHVERQRFLWHGVMHEQVRITNYGDAHLSLPLSLRFGADFRDMFEVRGNQRSRRGEAQPASLDDVSATLGYHGLDGVARASRISFSEAPGRISGSGAYFLFELAPHAVLEFHIDIGPGPGPAPSRARYRAALARARASARQEGRRGASLRADAPGFAAWIERSRADLALLTTQLDTGPYPYAGIPWFSTPFGRDAIITAMQTLWLDPGLARGVLAYLARWQATETCSFRDSAPGKIMHETRRGEMSALRELPFGRYYGSVDTTPLFVMLAGAYAERTGDDAFLAEIRPALDAATGWITANMDAHQGFLAYARGEESGLANQGWKDSHDSVFHADGRLAEGPIALVEVQGYAFAALRFMASLAERQGDTVLAASHAARAEAMRAAVEDKFWMEEHGTYALAIDGAGDACRVRSSNAGHLLFAGLPTPERAARVATALLAPGQHTGWGLRTIARGEARYNPMSYHNGSIWPHDTAVCAAGLARYGHAAASRKLAAGLLGAAQHFEWRLPELFCGFNRAGSEPPISYPVACLPQAWAAGSVFMLLQSCLGLEIDGRTGTIRLTGAHLPEGMTQLCIDRLSVGGGIANLDLTRGGATLRGTAADISLDIR